MEDEVERLSVLIKSDVRTVRTTGLLLCTDDDSLNDLAFLYVAAWDGVLDSLLARLR